MKLAGANQNNNDIEVDFHGASIVTASGKEIPITEQMLQRSFDTLIEAWERARPRKQNK